ncbi:hypothetical protein EOD39_14445 [Acipenser ruthenus]|uniref:Uncharacterized protein n=1 Tax=Acipenser ruthenus TaxID=7906 RepID=A0A662YN20_ACIRT|nr:hypothetical protein EOD39_14445 [Acipenser ruthenus]
MNRYRQARPQNQGRHLPISPGGPRMAVSVVIDACTESTSNEALGAVSESSIDEASGAVSESSIDEASGAVSESAIVEVSGAVSSLDASSLDATPVSTLTSTVSLSKSPQALEVPESQPSQSHKSITDIKDISKTPYYVNQD